jgi:hypothetical protein
MSFCIAFLRQIFTLHVIQRNVVLLSAILLDAILPNATLMSVIIMLNVATLKKSFMSLTSAQRPEPTRVAPDVVGANVERELRLLRSVGVEQCPAKFRPRKSTEK